VHQRRLAGSGLAPDEQERALALLDDLGEPTRQDVELCRPLDQLVGRLCAHRHGAPQTDCPGGPGCVRLER
jgi:hypothetical protein